MRLLAICLFAALLAPAVVASAAAGPLAKPSAPRTVAAGAIAVFDGSASQPGGRASIVKYSWSFDDGTKALGVSASHSFAKPGRHSATLTVLDSAGGTAKGTVSIMVTKSSSAPAGKVAKQDAARNPTKVTKPASHANSTRSGSHKAPAAPAVAKKPSAPANRTSDLKPATSGKETRSRGPPPTTPLAAKHKSDPAVQPVSPKAPSAPAKGGAPAKVPGHGNLTSATQPQRMTNQTIATKPARTT